MIDSRCGLLCSDCSFRETMGCKGCVNIDKPFWGDSCPVKSCCEKKGTYLISLNDKYDPIEIAEGETFKTFGRVVS